MIPEVAELISGLFVLVHLGQKRLLKLLHVIGRPGEHTRLGGREDLYQDNFMPHFW
jgi:hypothetical protein